MSPGSEARRLSNLLCEERENVSISRHMEGDLCDISVVQMCSYRHDSFCHKLK